MPFLNQITGFINDTLRTGSLDKACLLEANYFRLSTVVARVKNASEKTNPELLPAIVNDADGKAEPITPDSKKALQLYHKLLSKTYSYEKKSYGDGNDIRSVCEMQIVVINNIKLTGTASDALEPAVIFGMPQQLSSALLAELNVNKCLITPLSSIMDATTVFRQEYPKSDYFINMQMSMFSIRYRIETTFGQACVDALLCI